jgi:hypothetical protein
MNLMNVRIILLIVLCGMCGAQAQQRQCFQAEFSGEAKQGQALSQELGAGVRFSVNPAQAREDERISWFKIRVIGEREGGVFVFSLSDTNWILAVSDFWSAFIGGPNTDLEAALEYKVRYLLFPIALDEKQGAIAVANRLRIANTKQQIRDSVTALNAAHLALAKFEITDHGLGNGKPPTSVDWVKFNVKVTLPGDFLISGELPVEAVDCPQIPAEMIENVRNPGRHEFPMRESQ